MTRYTVQWRWAEKGSDTGDWAGGEDTDGDHAYKPVPTLDAARELLQRDIMGSVEVNEDVDPDGLIVKMLLAQASVAEVGQIITLPVPNHHDDLQHRIVEISRGKTTNQKETDT